MECLCGKMVIYFMEFLLTAWNMVWENGNQELTIMMDYGNLINHRDKVKFILKLLIIKDK